MNAAEWTVRQFDLERSWSELPGELGVVPVDLGSWARRLDVRHEQWFLLGPNGFPDIRVNRFLASSKFGVLAETTRRDYARSLALWLNFLEVRGCPWWEADEEHAEDFRFWRLTDPANSGTVQTSTFGKDVAACKKFYAWASKRYGDVADVFAEVDFPIAKREAAVKWLDPAAWARWRDVGLRGRDLSGRRDRSWRGRNEQRDAAFADGLYGSALRLSEWASVVLPELPRLETGRAYYTCALADRCAKGEYGHAYWLPRRVLSDVWAYVEGSRARVVRQAQAARTYERLAKRMVVDPGRSRGSVVMPDEENGGRVVRAWNMVRPAARRRMFRETSEGLEPVWLWLNEDGMPRDPHGWHHTFDAANQRIAAFGLDNFHVTPHMGRHSAALRWFSAGKMVYAKQLAHLDGDEVRDFREQFGDTWDLVQTMLGHRRVETTKSVYLEPFQNLSVEILLAQIEGLDIDKFVVEALAGHPRVINDPLVLPR
ncbi:site-specific integrase [Nocardia abscessus]|uniref:site-specific integrase n=1 Tax=Nocardia abscessus TaxID=120957 RepID=UPI001894918F|nr:site-specific integrase [Nocardia abscessus]MBF6221807.1 site-specific integrase [Nocardia abscessus]